MSDELHFESISKAYGSVGALRDVTLTLRQGEIFSLLGPSGCGKTTLLRVAAGFEQPDTGRVYLNGRDITDFPPNRREVNTIFQNYALFPHLSVRENIAFGPRVARRPKPDVARDVDRMLELVQIADQAEKRPHELSGGQRQRVAIARALVNTPKVLLLDEPLAALDLKLRQRMLLELDTLHDEIGITFLFVTHDQGEAMSLSDRVAVMNEGRVEQVGSPIEIYESPVSSFTAAFIGDTNFFDGAVSGRVESEYSRLTIDGFPAVLCFNDRPRGIGDLVHLSVRPEKLHISRCPPDPDPYINRMQGVVEDIIYLGSRSRYWVRVDEARVAVTMQHSRYLLDQTPITWDEPVWIWWHADDGFMLERYRLEDEELLSLPPEDDSS